jgi:hypothetical protein
MVADQISKLGQNLTPRRPPAFIGAGRENLRLTQDIDTASGLAIRAIDRPRSARPQALGRVRPGGAKGEQGARIDARSLPAGSSERPMRPVRGRPWKAVQRAQPACQRSSLAGASRPGGVSDATAQWASCGSTWAWRWHSLFFIFFFFLPFSFCSLSRWATKLVH